MIMARAPQWAPRSLSCSHSGVLSSASAARGSLSSVPRSTARLSPARLCARPRREVLVRVNTSQPEGAGPMMLKILQAIERMDKKIERVGGQVGYLMEAVTGPALDVALGSNFAEPITLQDLRTMVYLVYPPLEGDPAAAARAIAQLCGVLVSNQDLGVNAVAKHLYEQWEQVASKAAAMQASSAEAPLSSGEESDATESADKGWSMRKMVAVPAFLEINTWLSMSRAERRTALTAAVPPPPPPPSKSAKKAKASGTKGGAGGAPYGPPCPPEARTYMSMMRQYYECEDEAAMAQFLATSQLGLAAVVALAAGKLQREVEMDMSGTCVATSSYTRYSTGDAKITATGGEGGARVQIQLVSKVLLWTLLVVEQVLRSLRNDPLLNTDNVLFESIIVSSGFKSTRVVSDGPDSVEISVAVPPSLEGSPGDLVGREVAATVCFRLWELRRNRVLEMKRGAEKV